MSITLNNGVKMPMIGLGTFAGFDPKELPATQAWILTALQAGYRHLDTARLYGTEQYVGNAIKESGIPRNDIFITTKLAPNHQQRVAEAFEESLDNLGVDYIDLFLLHCPQAIHYDPNDPLPKNADGSLKLTDRSFNDTWADMEKLLATGKVKAIGVSNFSVKTLTQLLKTAKVIPAVNQIEIHPYLAENEVLALCKSKGIAVTAYASTGYSNVRENPVIVELAAKYKSSPAQVILAWHISRDTAVIPKSADPQRQKDNLKLPKLEPEDIKKISALNRNERLCNKPDEQGKMWGWTAEQYGW